MSKNKTDKKSYNKPNNLWSKECKYNKNKHKKEPWSKKINKNKGKELRFNKK